MIFHASSRLRPTRCDDKGRSIFNSHGLDASLPLISVSKLDRLGRVSETCTDITQLKADKRLDALEQSTNRHRRLERKRLLSGRQSQTDPERRRRRHRKNVDKDSESE